MKKFLRCWVTIAVLGYLALILLGVVLGDGAMLLGIILAVAALLALLVCVLERLTSVEKKLDKLLREACREPDGE